jgi:hypothetical protein
MFIPIQLLPLFNPQKREKYENRWHNREGEELRQYITKKIRAGAGEDFLEWDYDQGRLMITTGALFTFGALLIY